MIEFLVGKEYKIIYIEMHPRDKHNAVKDTFWSK